MAMALCPRTTVGWAPEGEPPRRSMTEEENSMDKCTCVSSEGPGALSHFPGQYFRGRCPSEPPGPVAVGQES